MTSKDVFSVAVRIVGLLFLYQGVAAVPSAVANFCPVFPHFNFRTLWPSTVMVGWPLAVAFYLIRGAPWLMRFAYPAEEKQEAGRAAAERQQASLLRS